MTNEELNKLPTVPVKWIRSSKDGKTIDTFSKPELMADRILSLAMLGHTDIQEVWPDVELGYLGQFLSWRQPF